MGAAEVTAYDAASRRLFVVNGANGTVDVVNLANPAAPVLIDTINVAALGAGVNSVAVHDGLVALAIQADPKTSPGVVAFYNASTLALINSVGVGALPDMLTFTPDGLRVLVANEGEPNSYGAGRLGRPRRLGQRDHRQPRRHPHRGHRRLPAPSTARRPRCAPRASASTAPARAPRRTSSPNTSPSAPTAAPPT